MCTSLEIGSLSEGGASYTSDVDIDESVDACDAPSGAPILVRMRFDRLVNQWRAETEAVSGFPVLRARGLSDIQARRRLGKVLETRFGAAVHVQEFLELPDPIDEKLRVYHQKHDLWRELDDYIRAERLVLADLMLQHRISRSKVAELIRLSVAQLAVLLRRDGIEAPFSMGTSACP